jgi:putative ABC transport system permease protein
VINGAAARSFEANVSVGDELRIVRRSGEPVNVTVVGTVEGGGGPFGAFSSQPRFYLPASEFYRKVVESPTAPGSPRQSVFPQVTVVAETGETEAVQSRVRAYLDESDARELAPSGYEVTARTNEDLVERVERVISRLTSFVTGIAVISLVVGAIGIANVMLVSVTERTKQIGVMKAVGARNRDVLQLFLVESVLLGLLGVLVGVPLGVASGWAAIRYVDLGRLVVPPTWFGIAVLVGVGVGVLAGLYPAWSAARTDPIEALRYE